MASAPAPIAGQTVLVTGGASGLGKVIARAFLDEGANVVVCDVNEARLAETRAEFGLPERFLAVAADITDEAAVEGLFAQAAERFGGAAAGLDVLVNNAGVADAFDPVADLAKEKWDRVVGINLTGSFLCMRGAVRAMLARDQARKKEEEAAAPLGGLVIQIGSVAALSGVQAGLAYTASKHGVAALVRHTAGHYGGEEGIHAVGLMLGAMPDTNIAESVGGLTGFNGAAFARSQAGSPPLDPARDAVRTADVARYCLVLAANRGVAASLSGTCVPFSRNRPRA